MTYRGVLCYNIYVTKKHRAFGGFPMNINIEILENGCVIVDGKIVVASDLTYSETQRLVKEYKELKTSVTVYTPDAIERKYGNPGFLERNIQKMGAGGTLGYMSDTLVKISPSFCILKDENVIQMTDLKPAV